MKPRYLYLVVCALGAILPWGVFIPWLLRNGPDLPRMVDEIAASPVAAAAWIDLLLAIVAVLAFILIDRRTRKVELVWLPIVGTLLVGVSFGLPLYLFLRDASAPS